MCSNDPCFQTIPQFLFYSVTSSALCFVVSTYVCYVDRPDLCVSWLLCQDTYPAKGGASSADRESDHKSVIMLHTYVRTYSTCVAGVIDQCIPVPSVHLWQCAVSCAGHAHDSTNRMCEWECGVVVHRHCMRWLRNYSVAGCHLHVLPVAWCTTSIHTQYKRYTQWSQSVLTRT